MADSLEELFPDVFENCDTSFLYMSRMDKKKEHIIIFDLSSAEKGSFNKDNSYPGYKFKVYIVAAFFDKNKITNQNRELICNKSFLIELKKNNITSLKNHKLMIKPLSQREFEIKEMKK